MGEARATSTSSELDRFLPAEDGEKEVPFTTAHRPSKGRRSGSRLYPKYRLYPFLTFAQRLLAASEILARASGLNVLFFFVFAGLAAVGALTPLTLAHRAR